MHQHFGSFHTFHEEKIAELATVSKMSQDETNKKKLDNLKDIY